MNEVNEIYHEDVEAFAPSKEHNQDGQGEGASKEAPAEAPVQL